MTLLIISRLKGIAGVLFKRKRKTRPSNVIPDTEISRSKGMHVVSLSVQHEVFLSTDTIHFYLVKKIILLHRMSIHFSSDLPVY